MNIYDIAKEANVSVATVSRVINQSDSVSNSTREIVEKVIEDMHYMPNANARRLSGHETEVIGVIFPDISNPFYSRILSGLSRIINKYNYTAMLFNAEENPERLHQILKTIQKERLRGMILNPIWNQDEETVRLVQEIQKNGIPVVLLDRDMQEINVNGVYSDDFGGAYSAVSHLIEIGHRRISALHGPLSSRPGYERLNGYLKALKDNGIEPDNEIIHECNYALDGTTYEITKKMMKQKQPPTAIFTGNNSVTLECIKGLMDTDHKIGKDIGLIGFDDIDILHYTNFQLSVVDRQVERMGAEAMALLHLCISKDTKTKHIIIMDTELILRGSEKCDGITSDTMRC